MLSGDLHHYARYARPGPAADHTAAAAAPTCTRRTACRSRSTVPPPPSSRTTAGRAARATYDLPATFPTEGALAAATRPACSAGCRWQPGLRRPARHPADAVHVLACSACSPHASRLTEQWLVLPIAMMAAGVPRSARSSFAKSPTDGARQARATGLLGALHGVVQIGARRRRHLGCGAHSPFCTATGRCRSSPRSFYLLADRVWSRAEVVLRCTCWSPAPFGVNLNELFAGQGDHRLEELPAPAHRRDGALTIYPIAVPTVSAGKWRATPDAGPTTRRGWSRRQADRATPRPSRRS